MNTPPSHTDMQALAGLAAGDADRLLCARFLPASAQPGGLVLLAFHNELIRVLAPARSAAVAGPMAGLIRLQWWREVLEKTRPPSTFWPLFCWDDGMRAGPAGHIAPSCSLLRDGTDRRARSTDMGGHDA